MRSPGRRLRIVASLSAGAFAVHELRYLLAFGSDARDALGREGHGYLEIVCPVLVLLVLCAAAQLLQHAGACRRSPRSGRGLRSMWVFSSIALMVTFTTQELVEGSLTAGHPAGIAGVFGGGGWLAVPLAVAFGLIVAFALREAEGVLHDVPLQLARPLRLTESAVVVRATSVVLWRAAPAAENLAGRGPPSRVV